MDLPAKPRYPIFRAVAGLCLTMAIVETEEPAQAEDIIPEATAAPSYLGQGAYMDGQASFVDLEANRTEPARDSVSNSANRSRRKREKREKSVEKQEAATGAAVERTLTSDVNTIADEESAQMLETTPLQGDVSDLSEASESESVDHQLRDVAADQSEKSVHSAGSESSYATSQSSVEPSDFSEIAYTLSSDDEALLDGHRGSDGGSASVTEACNGVNSA
eukprot:gene12966-14959_t